MDKIEIIKELKELLIKYFPGEIAQVILFGSQVNGDAREYSDYDVLIVVNRNYDWRYERKILRVVYKNDLKYHILTDFTLISNKELNTLKGKQPVVLEAFENGIVI
ncbi:MAG: nucleotidyltransferase domain-containing protein [Cytophagales bacterium]|nr:nucleotidyltransferase domain-containing protein [Cytophagales bacterium]